MNLNILGYIFYIIISYVITIHVGWVFFKNGEHYCRAAFLEHPEWVKPVNRMLLTGYYLVNLGFIAITLSYWEKIHSWTQLAGVMAHKVAVILLILGIMHYLNLWILPKMNFLTK